MEALARSPQHRGAYNTRKGRPPYDDEKDQANHRSRLEKIDRKVMWALASNHERDFDGKVPAVFRAVEANRKRLQAEEAERARQEEEAERNAPAEAQLSAMSFEELERSTPKMEDVLRAVCVKHGLTRMEISSKSRSKRLFIARQEFWYLCAKLTLKSYPDIARHLGRDHTTVLHGIRSHGKRNGIERLPRCLEYEE